VKKKNSHDFGWQDLEAVPPGYWLSVCQGREAVEHLLKVDSTDDLLTAIERFPILLLSTFPSSLDHLGQSQASAAARKEIKKISGILRSAQQMFAEQRPMELAGAMASLAFDLAEEEQGVRMLNQQVAVLLLGAARQIFPEGGVAFARCQMREALARQELGERGLEQKVNWALALELYEAARTGFERKSLDYAACLVNEANLRLSVAEAYGAVDELQRAITLYRQARPLFKDSPEYYRICLIGEGNAYTTLAESGISPLTNLKKAIGRFAEARSGEAPVDIGDARSMINEGVARIALADQGADPEQNYQRAVDMLVRARGVLKDADSERVRAQINEGNARSGLAELGRDAVENLRKAVELYLSVQRQIERGHPDYALCLMNEGAARTQLAELGIESQANWDRAATRYESARGLFAKESLNAGRCQMNEGAARRNLADLGIHPEQNLRRAAELYRGARKCFQAGSISLSRSLMNEATTRLSMAEWGINRRANLRRAVKLYEAAAEGLPRASLSRARCQLSECNARTLLAEAGSQPELNLREAIRLARAAQRSLDSDGLNAAACEVNEARALYALAEWSGQRRPLRRAERLLQRSAESLARAGVKHEALIAYQLLGTVESELGRWEEGRHAFSEAIGQAERLRYETQPRQRQSVQARNLGIFQSAIEVSLRAESYGEALSDVERMRSRTLADMLFERDRPPRNLTRKKWSEWQRLIARLSELDAALQASLVSPQLDHRDESKAAGQHRGSLVRERNEIESRLDGLETEIRAKDPDYLFAAEGLDQDDMQETAERLKQTIVSFYIGELGAAVFVLGPGRRPLCMRSRNFTEQRLRELVFGKNGDEGWVGAYQRFIDALVSQQGDGQVERSRRHWQEQMLDTLRTIYHELIGPLHEELRQRGESRVVFIAGGLLGVLPLHAAAWKDADGELRYLIEELEVSYAPSIAVLRRCLDRRRQRAGQALIASASGNQSPPLGYAGWEANRIASLLRSRLDDAQVLLLGEPEYVARGLCDGAADSRTLLDALPQQTVCHLTCHGKWNAAEPLDSGLQLVGGDPLTLRQLFREARLERAQLVALSACESSLGLDPHTPVEEYRGLPAGFLYAGGRCVVGSLWVVSDFPAALLMIRLYHNLLGGADGRSVNLSEALQQAQQWIIRSPLEEKLGFLRFVNQIEPSLSERNQQALEAALARCESQFGHPSTWAAFQAVGASAGAIFPNRRFSQNSRRKS
jgi:CHAT domain-containing protein